MKAAFIHSPCGPSGIVRGEFPEPETATDTVTISVRAVSVNPIDTYIRSGAVTAPTDFPYVLGCDAAGVVIQAPCGALCKVGDRVWTTLQGGASGRQGVTAERIAIPAALVAPIPEEMTFVQAAALGLPNVTAFYGLRCRCPVTKGQTVLIDGASGAVGTMAVQWAKLAGARVIAVTGTEAGMKWCEETGADTVLLRTNQRLEARLETAAGSGLDVWWDLSRNPAVERAVRLLSPGGHLIIASGRNARASFSVGQFYAKGLTMAGMVVYDMTTAELAKCGVETKCAWESQQMRVPAHKVLPWEQISEAHARVAAGEGRVVLSGFAETEF